MRAVRFRASWNCSPPIPAFTMEFQSISFTLPAEIACDSWYIAVAACWDVDPDAAATFDRPLMADTESFSPTPADVNIPMLCVISEKLYFVRSAYRFSSSRAAFTVWMFSPLLAVLARIVCTELSWSSYSLKPSMIGWIANDFTMLTPASMALVARLPSATPAAVAKIPIRLPASEAPLEIEEKSMARMESAIPESGDELIFSDIDCLRPLRPSRVLFTPLMN